MQFPEKNKLPAISGQERTDQIGIENCSPVSGAVLQVWGNGGGPIDDVMSNPQALVTRVPQNSSGDCIHAGLFPTGL